MLPTAKAATDRARKDASAAAAMKLEAPKSTAESAEDCKKAAEAALAAALKAVRKESLPSRRDARGGDSLPSRPWVREEGKAAAAAEAAIAAWSTCLQDARGTGHFSFPTQAFSIADGPGDDGAEHFFLADAPQRLLPPKSNTGHDMFRLHGRQGAAPASPIPRRLGSASIAARLTRENEALRGALGQAVRRLSELEGEQEHFLAEGVFELVNSLCGSGAGAPASTGAETQPVQHCGHEQQDREQEP